MFYNNFSSRHWDAFRLYLFMRASTALLFTVFATTFMLYQIVVVGLSPLQLVLVGTILEVSIFVLEVPTGVVADVYSRRLSVIIGYVLTGLGFLIMGSVPSFAVVLLGNFLWGAGYTFISGAESAWLVDEVGEARATEGFLRGSQTARLLGLAFVPFAILLGSVSLRVPLLVSGLGYGLLALLLFFVMPEQGFTSRPRSERETWHHLFDTFREGLNTVRGRPALTSLMIVGVVWGASSEGFDRLWQVVMIDNFTIPDIGIGDPLVVWFGLLGLLLDLLGIGITEIIRRTLAGEGRFRVVSVLFTITSVLAMGLFAYALADRLALALIAYGIVRLARDVAEPVFIIWANSNIESNVRATVLSMYGQSDALGQMAGGPAVGAIGNASLRLAMLVSGALILPALPVFSRVAGAERTPSPQAAD
jgi:MFS transporter, DHA3 family, tetracycline resistance protein